LATFGLHLPVESNVIVVGADREGDAQHRQWHGRPREGEQAVGTAEQRLAVVPQPVLDGDRDVVEQQQRLRNAQEACVLEFSRCGTRCFGKTLPRQAWDKHMRNVDKKDRLISHGKEALLYENLHAELCLPRRGPLASIKLGVIRVADAHCDVRLQTGNAPFLSQRFRMFVPSLSW
jgi:hypothetical protein